MIIDPISLFFTTKKSARNNASVTLSSSCCLLLLTSGSGDPTPVNDSHLNQKEEEMKHLFPVVAA